MQSLPCAIAITKLITRPTHGPKVWHSSSRQTRPEAAKKRISDAKRYRISTLGPTRRLGAQVWVSAQPKMATK